MADRPDHLIYDWNGVEDSFRPPQRILFDDETLRDGLQSPSVRDPELDEKIRILHLMDELGIDTADIGLPGAGLRQSDHIKALMEEIRDARLRIRANVACRTVVSDIEPAARIVQETGVPLEVCTFIGSSPIRQYVENWDLDTMVKHSVDAIDFAVSEGLSVMFVTEDTTRAHPDTLRTLYTAAIEHGAARICICDTCGHANPEGVHALVRYVRQIVEASGREVGIDWHGHRDRGLGLANCIAAIRAGADRIHATALGIGERCGNAEMDLLLVNLKLLGWIDNDLHKLAEYCETVARAVGRTIPQAYPVVGPDAFETATGVHAAAVIKAFRKGDHWLANRVYSGVPAEDVGRQQSIRVGPMSGKSNVTWVLEQIGIEPTEQRIQRILSAAKQSPRLLTDDEIRELASA